MLWNITPPDPALAEAIRHKIDTKTKPLGALGQLEALAGHIALVQQTLTPQLRRPHLLVFAADHGIAQAGVSQYPPEVTHQMVRNFAAGGAAINVFCRQNGLALSIVDAGVRGSLADLPAVRNEKIAEGTRNFAHEPAMSPAQCVDALQRGAGLADELHASGCNVLGVGEMGIGNTSAAAVLMHRLTGRPLAECVGRGTGLDPAGHARKLAILTQAVAAHPTVDEAPLAVLATFGGFEIAQMCGALLRAAEHGMLLLIDGFIASAALLVAARLAPAVLAYCVFCHESSEQGHRLLLADLGLSGPPLLRLDLRLGEGTGCALAYPLVQAAVNFLNEMASFESAGVSDSSGA
ncbi:nicotinate-nucleotide--dimethylbenzimidazole phosphoribosyltransferase [Hymenobacter sp. BT664]|uniref:Nicotinate-nucleotide--dimethylbenzimidazole phosphoribosyltransferase n=1 Tax=Hymenobacter montanus TaxID=2771359 RepID=A0A927BEN9_9BACT|nr:nicotinate-nucleotide--dimethylbenzimidazole phosphoribosyltransferase [Hymenobacter montanus]MBD2768689.1 nicotinate-nucleotide--dimethylbenzimidazole phosphoribosyltransferase [Hymenobacter montanus]